MGLEGWTHAESPFHAGEQAVQRRVGVRDRIEAAGRQGVRDFMPDQHRAFFAQLPMLVIGALDDAGQPWATLLCGAPGFVQSPDARTLSIQTRPLSGDPLAAHLVAGAAVGVLGLEPQTRRRNRANGHIRTVTPDGFSLAIAQSFGNCPQYIQRRSDTPAAVGNAPPEHAVQLDEAALSAIARADTFFIATHSGQDLAQGGADVSHRGGKAGFVQAVDARTLRWPEFGGNFFFNTLGNLQLNPRAGLLFPDFASGDLLYLAGRAEVIWDGAEVEAFAGAERLVCFHVARLIRLRARLPMRWQLEEPSPLLAATGDWDSARARLEHANSQASTLRLVRREAESALITSFWLAPADGSAPLPYLAGQHLSLLIERDNAPPLRRSYTLSQAPDGQHYRISVKRDGVASNWLHDHLQPGDLISAFAPAGHFVLDTGTQRPVLLISGGVGITPMMAMLDVLAPATGTPRRPRTTWFIHAARHGGEQTFAATVEQRAARHPHLNVHVRYSQPREAESGRYDSVGRIDAALLRTLLPLDDYDVYLCGPDAFMRQVYWALRSLGIARDRIHYEHFAAGAPLEADPDAPAARPAPTTPQTVTFAQSGQQALWQPGTTLLELAESLGITPNYSCRSGVCGSCRSTVLAGRACYPQPPGASVGHNEVLLCCAAPEGTMVLDL
ncbi:pyridoxamine 5'-phosphate oxidase family protein [Chitinibacteraceae bacterium HSL-7]